MFYRFRLTIPQCVGNEIHLTNNIDVNEHEKSAVISRVVKQL